MTLTEHVPGRETSRRRLLRGALVATGGAIIAVAAMTVGGEAAAASKMSQKSAGYRGTPLGKSRCDNCGLWRAPASCKTVDGVISPAGWCNLYNSK
jgi:hypothetical protein